MFDNTITRRVFLASLPLFLLIAAACGGGNGGGGSEEDRVRAAANEFVLTVFGVFSGARQPQALIDSLIPECRAALSTQEIAATVALIRAFVPDLARARMEAVDLGNLSIRKVGDQYLVRPTDPSAMRVRVNGQWVNADQFFSQIGFSEPGESVGIEDEIAFEIRNGRALVADCDVLGF
jgi:hypothetical protein